MQTHHTTRGFIALISVLIISAVLIVTVLSVAQFGVASRYFLLDLENKTASSYLASACVEIGRVDAYNNEGAAQTTARELEVGEETCTLDAILAPGGGVNIIRAQGKRGTAITNYCVSIEYDDGAVTEWREVDTLADCP